MFATSTQITETERMIKSVLNAVPTWAGAIGDARRFAEVVTKSRIYATLEVVKAIAKNPQHGWWGEFADYEDVDHNEFLPDHLGAHGIPMIVPFAGAPEQIGTEADPDEIDSYRNDTNGLFTRMNSETVAHDAKDSNDMPSVVSGLWSIVNGQLKFTGKSCSVPMVFFRELDCATRTPADYLSTIVKLSPLYNLKEGDNLFQLASLLVADGKNDLKEIEAGSMTVSPVSDVMEIQKEV